MAIRRAITKSLHCLAGLYFLVKLLYPRRRRQACQPGQGVKEVTIQGVDDQGALEVGNTQPRKNSLKKCDSLGGDHPEPRNKGAYFLSTSTIAEGDTPVLIPWRTVSEMYNDSDALAEKLSNCLSRVTDHSSSQDISAYARSVCDDSSIFGLSFLFDSDGDSYADEDTSYDFLQTDLPEISLGDLGPNWIQPVDSQWQLEVAAAMNAFRSSRVDHDDIVTSPGHILEKRPDAVKSGDSAVLSEQQQIEDWRNDFVPEKEASSSPSPSNYAAISRFRFP